MAWRLDGTYFESCSCDEVCPCTWSALTAKATLDRCRALLAYHIGSGEIRISVSGRATPTVPSFIRPSGMAVARPQFSV